MNEVYLPLYQGRKIHQFDHRANSVRVNPESIHNPYLSEETTEKQHSDAGFLSQSQYWVPSAQVEKTVPASRGYALGFRDIARPTDARTMIAASIPQVGCGHTLPTLLPYEKGLGAGSTACLLANLNSFVFDYVARQKVQGTHLTWYTVEQLPVIAPAAYDRKFGETTARALVRDHVLKLTYTAHDLAPFARDLGCGGPPFIWDEEERRHLRARLDACYFHLYGIDRNDAAYILSTFPIVHTPRPIRLWPLPHPRPHPRLHERPKRRRHRDCGRPIGEVALEQWVIGGSSLCSWNLYSLLAVVWLSVLA